MQLKHLAHLARATQDRMIFSTVSERYDGDLSIHLLIPNAEL
jgi:hypothetical protein